MCRGIFSACVAQIMAASVEPALATRYLEVTGMVTPDVLQDDTEYREVGLCTCTLLIA